MRLPRSLSGNVFGRYAAGFATALALLAAGCATDPLSGQRLARYRPDISAAERDFAGLSAGAKPAPADNVLTNLAAEPNEIPVPKPGTARRLKRGDRVAIHLRSIPAPQDIHDEIDSYGDVNLPLIGTVHLEGRTTSEAEKLIEKAYKEAKYYTRITVIVVAQADEYFMRGEIKSAGKYPLTGDITLLMAIAAAGGYTDYANPKKITIYRDQRILHFNAFRIEAGKDDDPLIEPGDIIVIDRRWV